MLKVFPAFSLLRCYFKTTLTLHFRNLKASCLAFSPLSVFHLISTYYQQHLHFPFDLLCLLFHGYDGRNLSPCVSVSLYTHFQAFSIFVDDWSCCKCCAVQSVIMESVGNLVTTSLCLQGYSTTPTMKAWNVTLSSRCHSWSMVKQQTQMCLCLLQTTRRSDASNSTNNDNTLHL